MANKRAYTRYFIIFQEDDKGFGIAQDKPPTGYAKIENKNGRSKVTFYVQNLLTEKGPYTACLIDSTKNPPILARLGNINVDETGRGEIWWEYREDDIAETGNHIDRFNVAAILVEGESVVAPLSGQVGKDRSSWKERLNLRARIEETPDELEEEELSEEALKFKEYEERIKDEIKKINNEEVEITETRDGEKEKYEYKESGYAKVFHKLLKRHEELRLKTEMENTRWWRIPLERPMMDPKYMPYFCVIYHILLAYPYMNYIMYAKKAGHYYFGLKYDDEGEIEYVIYGIEGENNKKDQPYFGATGFKKWLKIDDKKGMWIMIYNPWTGMVMM
ncbi:hypothetical protein ABG79_01826 [Caloramator mitchellensis]|uniref:DUF7922 domain-containing protein n=1 Tax=Caloramator mitchellensis TaxID=908809 RepID=A0A0R3JTH8_CALMK|nr:hypothetical protein [Caloramator mitchellensis]KRQ86314.1 hypothetical protein ABG79_01826 [Caloramator mitchellensis]